MSGSSQGYRAPHMNLCGKMKCFLTWTSRLDSLRCDSCWLHYGSGRVSNQQLKSLKLGAWLKVFVGSSYQGHRFFWDEHLMFLIRGTRFGHIPIQRSLVCCRQWRAQTQWLARFAWLLEVRGQIFCGFCMRIKQWIRCRLLIFGEH